MIRPPIRLSGPLQRQLAASYILDAAPAGCEVRFVQGDRRTPAQSDAMWAKLDQIAAHVVWCGKRLTAEDWKDVFTASLRKARVVPTIDGDGFVPLGMSTSRMTRDEMSNLLALIDAFAAERGIVFAASESVERLVRPRQGNPRPLHDKDSEHDEH